MIPIQTKEELLSIAYVSAIVASAGAIAQSINMDFGVDLSIRRIGEYDGKRIDMGTVVDLQLKATINWDIDNDEVIYDIDAEAYNRIVLRRQNAITPCVLLLCCLPKKNTNWVNADENRLILRKCCYYHEINGEKTSNTSSKRLKIPRNQLLTENAVIELIKKSCGVAGV